MTTDTLKVTAMKKGINAVDLITITVFAVLFRVLFYIFKLLGVVFPFNHTFMYLVSAFTLVACVVLVNKKGVFFLYTVAWSAINFFLQGEIPLYWALIVILPLIPELYLMARSKNMDKPGDAYIDTKNLMFVTFVYNILYMIWNFVMIVTVFKIPVPMHLILIVMAISCVCTVIGVIFGKQSGLQLKKLLG
jgi:hypothetical protein